MKFNERVSPQIKLFIVQIFFIVKGNRLWHCRFNIDIFRSIHGRHTETFYIFFIEEAMVGYLLYEISMPV